MLDRQYRHGIQCSFGTVQGKISRGAEVDHEFSKITAILDWPANQGRVFKRHKHLTDCEHGTMCYKRVFFEQECVKSG